MIQVACGVLVNAGGEVLIAQRPEGKIAAGKWEFPGGKIEAGESPLQALVRELHEELGVEVRAARRLLRFRHEYADRIVILDTWLVHRFEGEPHSREQQLFDWVPVARLHLLDTLPTVAPIALALRLPQHYVFTPPNADEALIRAGLPHLPRGSLLRLRIAALDDQAYADLATRLRQPAQACGVGLMLDRQPHHVAEIGAAGWHATERALRHAQVRPVGKSFWFAASVHDAAGMDVARRLGVDFGVLGSVLPTASHPQGQALGWERWQQLRGESPQPVYAIGGVGPQQLEQAHEHGAQGVAGIRAYWQD
ncbi:MAG: Nudix family hydrolase [Nevskia sp.]|nr:Nudix family hydrolase [Nevskia sp.]